MIVENIEDRNFLNIEINDEIGADKEIIGTFVKNSAKLTIHNLNHEYDYLKGKYIEIKNFGSWFVNDLINNEDSTEANLSLYDISNKFDEDYNDKLYSFPCKMGEWATQIGNNVGVPLKGTFINYDLEIKEAPYLGTNPANKDAVKLIAKYASGYAQINRDDTYSIKWFDSTLYEIEDWESFSHGNESKVVNKVVLSTGDTGDNECYPHDEPENPFEIKIIDDWTNIDRTGIIEDIYNLLKGFKYTPIIKLEVPYGLLELRAGQMIKAQDVELKNITTYISKHKLTWDGGDYDDPNSWSSSISMSEIAETSTKHSYSENIKNQIRRVERTVNKQNLIIEDIIEVTDENSEQIAKWKMENDSILLEVNQKINGTNLILDSDEKISSNNYLIAKYNLSPKPTTGKTYTCSLKGTLGENRTMFSLYNSGYLVGLADMEYDEDKQIYKATFEWIDTINDTKVDSSQLYVFARPDEVYTPCSIDWIKLEEGSLATLWSPSPQDFEAKLELKVGKDENDQIVSMLNQAADIIRIIGKRFIVESDLLKLTANDTDILEIPISVDYDYTQADAERVINIYLEDIIPTAEDYKKYDLNNDGEIDLADAVNILSVIQYGITKSHPGKFKITSDGINSQLCVVNGYGSVITSLNLGGIETTSLIVRQGNNRSVFSSYSHNLIRTALSADFYIPSTAETIIPLNEVVSRKGETFTIQSSQIKINGNVSWVEVTGQLYFYTGTMGSKTLRLYKNDTLYLTKNFVVSSAYEHISIPSMPIDVKNGDIISLRFTGSQGDRLRDYNHGSFLYVKVIE